MRKYDVLRFTIRGEDFVVPFSEEPKYDHLCVFLDHDKRCAIYDERPDICREFGEEKMPNCPFIKPDGTLRCGEETRKMIETEAYYYALVAALIDPSGKIESGETDNEYLKNLISLLLRKHPVAFYMATIQMGIDAKSYFKTIQTGETAHTDVTIPKECLEQFVRNLRRMGCDVKELKEKNE